MSEEKLEMLEMTINADKVFDVNFHNVSKELLKAYKDLQQENKQLKEELQEANDNIIWWSNRFKAVQRDYENLKERIEETIECINENTYLGDGEYTNHCDMLSRNELLEILGDKENE